MVAFPAGVARSDDDRVRAMQLFGEAVGGFDVAVAAHALKRIRLRNPRNPFLPTAQDLYELYTAVHAEWAANILGYYGLGRRSFQLERSIFKAGPKPLEGGCFVPDGMVTAVLRARLAAPDIEADLLALEDIIFDAIPNVAFEQNQRKRIVEQRAAAKHRAKVAREELDYIDSLPPALRDARDKEILECFRRGIFWPDEFSEDQLIVRAHMRLERSGRTKGGATDRSASSPDRAK